MLLIATNGHGGAGYGVGTHKDADVATKYALRKATRDMIAIGTHNGQLYHDLMGKKNNHKVLIRTGACASLVARVHVVTLLLASRACSAPEQGRLRLPAARERV